MSETLLSLERLVYEAYQRLEDLGYSLNTRNRYRQVWQALLRWARKHEVKTLTSEIFAQFLEEYGIPPYGSAEPLDSRRRHIRAYIRALEEFAFNGYWHLHRRRPVGAPFPPEFETGAEGFLNYRKTQYNLSDETLSNNRETLLRFALFLKSCHIKKWTDLQAENIRAFFVSQMQLKPTTLHIITAALSRFLKYLWFQGVNSQDLSLYLPRFKVKETQRIPSVWHKDDVEKLLSVVDRHSPKGKRDYAILILASQLGLRVGEIRTLKLEDIHWEKSQLEVFQPKTGNTVLLPLSEEVGQALIDYLRHGRPPVDCREVFIRQLAPFGPFSKGSNIQHIVTVYRRKAGISLDPPIHQGLHSLRHTLATRLLEQGTSMETIAAILGHASVESTYTYTKVSLETLRNVALDPEEVFHE